MPKRTQTLTNECINADSYYKESNDARDTQRRIITDIEVHTPKYYSCKDNQVMVNAHSSCYNCYLSKCVDFEW